MCYLIHNSQTQQQFATWQEFYRTYQAHQPVKFDNKTHH